MTTCRMSLRDLIFGSRSQAKEGHMDTKTYPVTHSDAEWRKLLTPEQYHIMAKRFQVIIVGGGPVGVALAVQLGLRGVSCALIESRTELGRIPKGQNLTHRTLEHFYFMQMLAQPYFRTC